MAEIIIDGTGTGSKAKVDGNHQLHTFAVSETEQEQASSLGNSYNINTGWITGISGDSALMYFKNNEAQAFVVQAIAVGLGSGTSTDVQTVVVIKNPATGDIITNAVDVDINENRNFGSSQSLSGSTAYKGADGDSFTSGSDVLLIASNLGGRLFASIDMVLERGSSIGVRLDTVITGNTRAYVALIGYLKDEKND